MKQAAQILERHDADRVQVIRSDSDARGPSHEPPLQVLYVTPRFLPFTGGVESHVYEVARRLARRGVEVTVLTTDPDGRLSPRENIEGIDVRRVRAYPARKDYYWAPALRGAIQHGDWDVVHVQSYHTLVAPLAMCAAWRAKLPYVVTFHGGGNSSAFRNAARHFQRALLHPLLARADRLIALAPFEISLYGQRLAREKFVVIPNGCELPKPERSPSRATEGTWIASVGRLEKYKGHQRAVDALPYVLQTRPDVRLWIAGSGPYEEALREKIAALGLQDHVKIAAVPPHERARMARELAQVALVLLFSEYETQPIAVLEALALGRPALVAQTTGLSELVERGLARGVASNSTPPQIAAAILEQLAHPLIPDKLTLPTWEDCAENLLDLYRLIVWRRRCEF